MNYMDSELKQIIIEQQKKIDEIYASVEKTRKYFLWTLIGTAVLFVLPLIILLITLPSFISSYTATISDLGI